VCTLGATPALLCGPSTSPLDSSRAVRAGLKTRRFDAFSSNRSGRIILWAFDHGGPMRYGEAMIDEAVLAVLYLTAWEERGLTRVCKGIDWEAANRLHERGLIDDPKSKSKSVIFIEEGLALEKSISRYEGGRICRSFDRGRRAPRLRLLATPVPSIKLDKRVRPSVPTAADCRGLRQQVRSRQYFFDEGRSARQCRLG